MSRCPGMSVRVDAEAWKFSGALWMVPELAAFGSRSFLVVSLDLPTLHA